MPWLFDEEQAMKDWFSGIKVVDSTSPVGGRQLKTRFRFPERQEDAVYPMLTLDLLDIVDTPARQQLGRVKVSDLFYSPDAPDAHVPNAGYVTTADYPIAVDFLYQVATYSRSANHDRQIQAAIWQRCPGRFGVLRVNNTDRYLQMVASTKADRIDASGQRMFSKIYTMRLSSELWPSILKDVPQVRQVVITIPVLWPERVVLTQSKMDCAAG